MFKRAKQGAKRGWLKAAGIIFLAGIAITLSAAPVYADITDPTVMEIQSVRIVHNLWEPDDFLLVFQYTLSWDPVENEPDQPADQTFIFKLMNGDETETYGYALPYVYVYNGYRAGVASMYWDSFTAPPWLGTCVLWFQENPGLDPNPTTVKRDISAADYTTYDTKEDNQDYLGDYIITSGRSLEQAWAVSAGSIIGADNYLTADGETYYQGAIPGLLLFCPDVFGILQVTPTYTEEEWTLENQNQAERQWTGTWVGDALEGLSGLFGGARWSLITMAACGFGFLGLLFFCYSRFEDVKPGLLLGILPLVAGSVLGMFPLVMLGLICFAAIMFIVYTFFFKAAT